MALAHTTTKVIAAVLLGLCSYVSVVAAQNGPVSPATSGLPQVDEQWLNTQKAALAALDPAMVHDVRQLLEIQQAKRLAQLLIAPLLPLARANFIKALPPALADREHMADVFVQKLETRLKGDDYLDLVVFVYTKYLTHEDVRALLAFYGTSAGQHWLAQEQNIARESQTLGALYMSNVVGPLIVQELVSEFGLLNDNSSSHTPPTGQEPVRVGTGGFRAPQRTRKVEPLYPSDALAARVEGTVVIDATIGTDGNVQDARVLQSIPLLDAAALSAVRQWKYSPTLLNGTAVPVIMTVTMTFKLE